MRGLTRRWTMRSPNGFSTAEMVECKPDPAAMLVQRVLNARGLLNHPDSGSFLSPSLKDLHDPSAIPDLDLAAERILAAAAGGERIVIYGDYDVDGITATCILHHIIRAVSPAADVVTYVPHRMEEGYGLNTGAVKSLAADGAGVIVSVDCGITAIEPARAARRAGVDLIITDHHNPPTRLEDMPEAFAVVHPRRPDSAYPFGDLPGAGVAYKLAWRLATMHSGSDRVNPVLRELLVELLAPAALGVIADIVPLVGENRVIARFGLERIKHTPLIGLRALVEASGLAGERVGAYDVGFRLGPRLNAAGRMGHAREAVELFTTADRDRAFEIAEALTRQNDQRRAVERRICDAAAGMAESAGMAADDARAIVLAHADWHPGVVGIVCSRLVERYCRPVILMQREGGVCRGSGRSIDGFNLHGALESCADLLDRYGGHDMAAGVSLAESNLDAFRERFTALANDRIPLEHLVHELTVDCEAGGGDLTEQSVSELESLAPFGRGNPSVNVLVRSLRLTETPRAMGTGGRHLSLQAEHDGRRMRLIAWGWGERRGRLAAGMRVDAVIKPKLSHFRGRTSVEPELRDLRPIGES